MTEMAKVRSLQAVESGSAQGVYQALRRKIVSMDLPPGSDLDEKMLVDTFGVSRTPVREALIKLAAEGLVEIRRNRGAFVAPLDLKTLQSFFEAADLVQRAIMRLAAMRRTTEDLKKIETYKQGFARALKKQDMAGMVELNHLFHLRIGEAARNQYLLESYRRILVDHERIAQLCYSHNVESHDEAAAALTLQQHEELYEALVLREADRAERIAKEHFDFCKTGIRQILAEGQTVLADLHLEGI